MKLRYYLLSILAGAALAAGCAREEVISSLAEFKPEFSCIGLPYEGGISSTGFTATASWSVDENSVPKWLTVTPTSGGSGSSSLVFATDPNPSATARTADVLVNVGGRQQRLIVTQAGAGPIDAPISTIKEVMDGSDGEVFRIKGTVTGIRNTNYGNIDVKDATGSIYIYGVLNDFGQAPKDAEGGWESFGIEVGDVVTLQGPRSLYNGVTLELVNASIIEVEKAQILMDETEFKVGSDAGTLDIFATVKAKGVLVVPADPWIRVTDIRAGKKDEVIYSVEYDANTTSKARKGVIEFKAPGYVMEVSINQQGIPPTGRSVTEIVSLDDNTLVETLPSVVVAKSGQGYIISDGTSAIYVYDKNKEFTEYAVGDQVKVFATKTTYGGVPELATLTAIEKDGTAPVNHPAVKDITGEALTYAASSAEYIQFTGKLVVSEKGYCNVEIDGIDPSKKQGSIVSPPESMGVKDLNGKNILVAGYFNGLSGTDGMYLNVIATKVTAYDANAKGTVSNPFTPAEAAEAVKDFTWTSNSEYEHLDDVYVKGKISRIAQNKGVDQYFTSDYGNASFYISADGTESGEFYVFRTLYLGNRKWVEGDTQIKVGDEVVIFGQLMNYQGNTPETAANKSCLYSLNGKTE
jgi:hypothetical protein